MGMDKLVKIMNNFEESFLSELLGDLNDSLIEWSINGNLMTKKNKIEIIIGVRGIKLFEDEAFRYNFIMSCEDQELLKSIASVLNFSTSGNLQLELAEKLKKIQFGDKEPYKYIINNYLGITDYSFATSIKEPAIDIINKCEVKFYELFDYQYMIKQQVMNDLANSKKDLYKILVHMPTGTGKTKTTMHIISQYINFVTRNNGIVVWIAHSDELLQQAYDTFKNVWSHLALSDIKVYKGWVEFPSLIEDGILFTSIQALQKKYGKPIMDEIERKASLIVFDEVHKAGASVTKKCLDYLMHKANDYGKKFVGLTATPGRTTDLSRENLEFSMDFDDIIGIDVDRIYNISLSPVEVRNYRGSKDPIKYFQENRYLSKIKKEIIDFKPSDEIVKQLKKELKNDKENYSDAVINQIATNKSRNLKIVEKLRELNDKGIPTIVFACSLQHAKLLSAFLKLINIPNSLVYGDMNSYERKKAISDFKKGNVNIIINYEILTTGFDSTNIKCVFITRPTKSVILYSQMIGRGLRGPKMGGNEECLLIDVEENVCSFNENEAFMHFDKYWN